MGDIANTLNNIDVDKAMKLVSLTTGLVTIGIKLANEVTQIINDNKSIAEEDKATMIANIKKAQESVPAWE